MENNQKEQGLVLTTERRKEDLLNSNEKKIYELYIQPTCCGSGINGLIINLIVFSGINFVFIIVALSTLIKKNAYYLILYTLSCPLDNALDDYLGGLSSFSSLFEGYTGTDSSFKTFWCNIGSFEDGVLISYLIFYLIYWF